MTRHIAILATLAAWTAGVLAAAGGADAAGARLSVRELSTGRMAVRVPEGRIRCSPPRVGRDIPGPILAVRGPDGVWRGNGWVEGPTRVVEIDGAEEAGEYVITYAFVGGGRAEVRLRVPKDTDHVRVTEECYNCTNTWVLSFAENFGADRVLAKPTEADGWSGVRRVRAFGHRRHGRLTLWSDFGRWLDFNDAMGVFGGQAKSDFVGFIRVHPETWRRPSVNHLSLWERDGRLRLEGNWQAGRREWLLLATSRRGDHAADARDRLRAIEREWVWNTSGWVLDWDAPLAQYRPQLPQPVQIDKETVLAQLAQLDKILETNGYVALPETRRFVPVYQTYERLRQLGAFTPAEDRRARRTLAALAYNCYRKEIYPWDRAVLPPGHPESLEPLGRGLLSPTLDAQRCAIVGELGLILRGHPMAAIWTEHFVEHARLLLRSNVYPGGCWEEGLSGACDLLPVLTPAAMRAQQARAGDLLTDERFRAMWEFFIQTATPRLLDRGGRRSLPMLGERPDPQTARDLLLLGAAAYQRIDPRLAARLLWLHGEMGGTARGNPAQAINALLPGGWPRDGQGVKIESSADLTSAPQQLGSVNLPGLGAVLRGGNSESQETCLILRSGAARRQGRPDAGSIHLYAAGVPLIVDAGCGDAGPWRQQARGHSRVAFADFEPAETSQVAAARDGQSPSSHIRFFAGFPGVDFAWAIVPTHGRTFFDPGAPFSHQPAVAPLDQPIVHQRRILFMKPSYFVLYDEIDSATLHEFWLHVAAAPAFAKATAGERATFQNPQGPALDVIFLEPLRPKLHTGAAVTSAASTQYLMVEGENDGRYRAILHPRGQDERPLQVESLAPGVIEVRHRDGWDLVVLDKTTYQYKSRLRQVALEASIAAVRRSAQTWSAILIAGKSISLPGLTIEPNAPVSVVRDREGRLTVDVAPHAKAATVKLTGRWLSRRQLHVPGKAATAIENLAVEVQLPAGVDHFSVE